jgi:hypothetical protein
MTGASRRSDRSWAVIADMARTIGVGFSTAGQ